MLSRVDETDLAIPLHDGIHEVPRWATFLARLRRRCRADGAAFVVRPAKAGHDGETIRHWSGDPDGPARLDAIRASAMRPSRVYGDEDLDGAAPLRAVRIDEPGGRCLAWIGVSRARQPFGAAESALLAGLVPHAEIALRNWVSLERARAHVAGAEMALARFGGGWLAVDGEGRIADLDRGAADMLRSTFGMTHPLGERLPVAARGGAPLAEAIAAFAGDRDAAPHLIVLSDQPRLAMLAAPAPDGMAAALHGCLRHATAHDHRPAILTALFGLSTSEARLAAALAAGASLAQGAAALGLTIETARNYSKRIFAKTGARGQADLVRLILDGVAAFA